MVNVFYGLLESLFGDALPQHLSRLRKFVNEASSEIADYKLCLSKIIDLDGTDPMD